MAALVGLSVPKWIVDEWITDVTDPSVKVKLQMAQLGEQGPREAAQGFGEGGYCAPHACSVPPPALVACALCPCAAFGA